MTSKRNGEEGSIPLVILMSIVVAGMLSVTFTILRHSTQAVASDRNFTFAIQVADAGLNQALHYVNQAPSAVTSMDSSTATNPSGGTPDTSLGDEQFEWTANWNASSRSWELRSVAQVGERTRRIEATARKVGIFQAGAFADRRLEFAKNQKSSSYPLANAGSVGSNNLVIIGNNSDPDLVILGGDAECFAPNGTTTCNGETNNGKYLLQPSNRFDIAGIDTQIQNDMASICAGAFAPDQLFRTAAAMTAYFAGGGTFCFTQLTIGAQPSDAIAWDPPADVTIYVDGNVILGNSSVLNCSSCVANPGTATPASGALTIYMTGDFTMGNQSHVAAAIAAPNGLCGGNGGSSAGTHFYGSLVCDEMANQGDWSFRYDTRLSSKGADRFVITGWREEVGNSTSF